jgi:hypothetical protein
VFGLVRNAAGQIYVVAYTSAPAGTSGTVLLQKLDGAGHLMWSSSLEGMSPIFRIFSSGAPRLGPDGVAVAPSGDVLLVTQSFVRAYRDDGSIRWTTPFLTFRFRLHISVGADGTAYVASETDFPETIIERFDANGQSLGGYGLPELSDDAISLRSYKAFLVAGNQLICQSGHTTQGLTKVHSLDAATGRPTWLLDGLDRALEGPLALAVDGQGAVIALAQSSGVRKLDGRRILWRRTASHSLTPGGALDATGGWDVAGDSRGRAIEVGSWDRCITGRRCFGEERVSGFVRVYDP